jgi:pimeloyl-ACP methyl ester carboxylesterase
MIKDYAKIASAHYNFDKEDIEKNMAKDLPEGYKVNYGLSNRGVMVTEKGNESFISIKGTNPANKSDVLSDVQLALGLHKSNIQFRQRKNEIKNILKRNPEREYTLIGHSLGGSIVTNALASSPSILRNIKKAHTFNTGSTPAFQSSLKPRKENIDMLNEKLEHHKTKADIISATPDKFGETTFHKQKSRNPLTAHSLSNFI